MNRFPYNILTGDDLGIAMSILDRHPRSIEEPDFVIAPDGEAYLYRWYLRCDQAHGNQMFHIQTRSDPERPLHDHPWDNMSVILSGGYDELYECAPELVAPEYYPRWEPSRRPLRKGSVVFRKATTAHRLILPAGIPYTMTMFSTGPKVREWGFWYPEGFRHYTECTSTENGVSVHVHE